MGIAAIALSAGGFSAASAGAIGAAVVADVVSGLGAVQQHQGQKQQVKAAKRQAAAQARLNREQQRRDDVINARQQRNLIRRARIERAAAVNTGFASGLGDTSSLATGLGGLQSQLGSNLGFSNTLQTLGASSNVFRQQIGDAQSLGLEGKADAAFGAKLSDNASTIGGFAGLVAGSSIFQPTPQSNFSQGNNFLLQPNSVVPGQSNIFDNAFSGNFASFKR